jgi:hypothetical protein
MKYRFTYWASVFLLIGTALAQGQEDPLALYEGVWISSTAARFIFFKVGADRVVSLPTGQASLRVSDGENGSNLKVSGEGFDCYYAASRINSRTMAWELKGGSGLCPQPIRLERLEDPKPPPVPTPPPAPPATPAPPSASLLPPRSSWTHNNSIMSIQSVGDRITIYYDQPRQGMIEEGVRRGTVLFEGQRTGNRLSGKSYVFDRRCNPVPYDDDGVVSSEREIVLSGRRVPSQLAGCQPVAYRVDPNIFYRRD